MVDVNNNWSDSFWNDDEESQPKAIETPDTQYQRSSPQTPGSQPAKPSRSTFDSFWDDTDQAPVEPIRPQPQYQQPGQVPSRQAINTIFDRPTDFGWTRLDDQFVEGAKDVVRSTLKGASVLSEDGGVPYTEEEKAAQEATKKALGSIRYDELTTLKHSGVVSGFLDRQSEIEELQSNPELLENQTFLEKLVRTSPQVLGQVVVGIASAGALSLPFMGLQIVGSSYENYIAQGADPEKAKNLAVLNALIQSPLEAIGIGAITKFVPAKRAILKAIKDLVSRGATEGLTEFIQQFPDAWTNFLAANPDSGMLDALWTVVKDPDTWKDGAEAAAIGAILGGGIATPIVAYDHYVGKYTDDVVTDDKPSVGETEVEVKGTNPDAAPAVSAPGDVKSKTDARSILEEAGRRMVEEQTAQQAVAQQVQQQAAQAIPDPNQMVGGGLEAPVVQDEGIQGVLIPSQVDQVLAESVSTKEAPKEDRDLMDLTKEEIDSMSFKDRARLVLGEGADEAEVARVAKQAEDAVKKLTQKEVESTDGARDVAAAMDMKAFAESGDVKSFVDTWMKNPEARPSWANQMAVPEGGLTDLGEVMSRYIKDEASKGFRIASGDVTVPKESSTFSQYKVAINDLLSESGSSAVELYGKDFLTQVQAESLTPLEKVYQTVIGRFFNRPVFFGELNKKAKGDPAVAQYTGSRFATTAGIVVVRGKESRMIGTIFHELAHDMKRTNPDAWEKLSRFIRKNINDNEALERYMMDLRDQYGDKEVTINDEFVSFVVGGILEHRKAQQELFKKLKAQDPSLYRTVLNLVKSVLIKFKSLVLSRSRKSKKIDPFIKDIDRAINDITDMLAEHAITARKGPWELTIKDIVDTQDFEKSNKKDQVWYSKLQEFISSQADKLPAKADPAEWKKLFTAWATGKSAKGLVKKNEIEAVRLMEFFDSWPTSEDIEAEVNRLKNEDPDVIDKLDNVFLDYIFGNDRNAKRQESQYRDFVNGLRDRARASLGNKITRKQVLDYVKRNTVKISEVKRGEVPGATRETRPAKYTKSEYNYPGGERYFEILLTLPNLSPAYKHRHWPEKNVVAFIRGDSRIVDGKKVLFLQEAQSDWVQEGRKGGFIIPGKFVDTRILKQSDEEHEVQTKGISGEFKTDSIHPTYFDALERIREIKSTQDTLSNEMVSLRKKIESEYKISLDDFRSWKDKTNVPDGVDPNSMYLREIGVPEETVKKFESVKKAYLNKIKKSISAVPDMPYKSGATDLIMKRAVKLAADNGYDYLAWASGDIISERWNLTQYVDKLVYNPNMGELFAFKDEEQVVYHKTGIDGLDDIVGSEIADKIRSKVESSEGSGTVYEYNEETGEYDDSGDVELTDLELRLGSDWAYKLYDEQMKNRVNALFGQKKWGNPKAFRGSIAGDDSTNKKYFVKNRDHTWMLSEFDNIDSAKRYIEERQFPKNLYIEIEDLSAVKVNFFPITKQLKDGIGLVPSFEKGAPEEVETITSPRKETGVEKSVGVELALSAIDSAISGDGKVSIAGDDYGSAALLSSMGFKETSPGNFKLDERIPKDVDIITGMFQAAWHVDLKSKRGAKELFDKIAKQPSELKGSGVDKKQLGPDKEKLSKYLNQSWPTFREAQDVTGAGDLLPTKNILVRPKGVDSGKGRQLLVQISSDFRAENSSNIGDPYYEALYEKREGYTRPSRDFWEIPEWMTRMAFFLPKADIYVIRSVEEAKKFFNQAGYDNIFFSVLDTNKRFVKDIAQNYSGKIIAGGYLPDGKYYEGLSNVSWMSSMEEAAEKVGVPFKFGVDSRHFKGTRTIPRLELSRGCLHKCAFCSQERVLKEATDEQIEAQVKAFENYDYELVYLNDKTFGQAKNFGKLVEVKRMIKKTHPNFKGFVIQTTATQFMRMSDEFLKASGIVYVELGVETFNDKFLSDLNKPHREKHIRAAAKRIRDLKMVFVPNVMVGLFGTDKKTGKRWVESAKTYGNTLKFFNENLDIISHFNIGVLAAETGTELQKQLEDWQETDSDEATMERSWISNKKIHEKYYQQLSDLGLKQLGSEAVAKYSSSSIKNAIKDREFDEKSHNKEILEVRPSRKEIADIVDLEKGNEEDLAILRAKDKIFEYAKAARGLKNVRKWMSKQKELNGLPVTENLIDKIGRIAEISDKDPERRKKLKTAIYLRNGLATGELNPTDKKVIKRMTEIAPFGDLMPYTVRYTSDNFYIGNKTRYGKFKRGGELFGGEIGKESKQDWVNPITGQTESVQKIYDTKGNRLIEATIFSEDRATRLREIKALVKRNIKYADWYERWKNFMWQFVERGVPEVKLKRIVAISGIVGTAKDPQTQQVIWSKGINALESGRKPHMFGKDIMKKAMDIWDGKYDDVLGRTDDEGMSLIIETFGRKIGPYLAAAMDPKSPNVLVLDRHMPKLWGYNILATAQSPRGGFNLHPGVEYLITKDIVDTAKDMGLSVAGVQAALWFEARSPKSGESDMVKISQVEPSRTLPYVFWKLTIPTEQVDPAFIHYKKTPLLEGEFVIGSTPGGKSKPNVYSMTDIGERIGRATEKWPYEPAVYMYQAGGAQESQVKTGRRAHTFKFNPSEIYDGVTDPLKYWETASIENKKDPGASLTNIFLNIVRRQEQYNGAIVKSPYGGKEPWLLMFDKVEVQDFPELTNIGISDIVQGSEQFPQDPAAAVKLMKARASNFERFLRSLKRIKKYEELTIDRAYPSIARFSGATDDVIEVSLGLKLDGPLRAQRSYLSEAAISRMQKWVYIMHGIRKDESYPVWMDVSPGKLFIFKAINKYNGDPARLINDLKKDGIQEFNIVQSPADWLTIEQFTYSDEGAKAMADVMAKYAEKGFPHNEVRDVHSEMIGSDNVELSVEKFKLAIEDYWGKTKGKEIIENAIREREEFHGQVRSGAYQERIASGEAGKKPGRRGPKLKDVPGDRGIQGPDFEIGSSSIRKAFNSNRVWDILLKESDIRSGPFDGGCLVCAKAIIRTLDSGSLVRIESDLEGGQTEHYGARIGDVIVDASGAYPDRESWIDAFGKNENIDDRNLSFATGYDDESDIPDDPSAVKEISKELVKSREEILSEINDIDNGSGIREEFPEVVSRALVSANQDDFVETEYKRQVKERRRIGFSLAKKLGGKYTRKVDVPGGLAPYTGDYASQIEVDGAKVYFIASSENGTIYLPNIVIDKKSSGLGTKFMEALKEFADETSQNIEIYKITNKKFFDKFDWLEDHWSGDRRYEPKTDNFIGVGRLIDIWNDAHGKPGVGDIDLERTIPDNAWFRGTRSGSLRSKRNGVLYFSKDRHFALGYGNTVKYYTVNPKKTFDSSNIKSMDRDIMGMIRDHSEFPNTGDIEQDYGDWATLEDPKVFKALKEKGYDSYTTTESGGSIAVWDNNLVDEIGLLLPNDFEKINDDTKAVLDRVGRSKRDLPDKVNKSTDIGKVFQRGVTAVVDKLNPLRQFSGAESEAYMLHRALPGIQSSINAMLEHGKLRLEESGVLTTDTVNEGFVPWLKKLGADSDKFWYWLIANRDQAREARDKKYKPMFTNEERSLLLNWTGNRTSDGRPWQVINKEFQEFNSSVLEIGVKSGLLDEAAVRQFKDEFYIPFYRIFEDGEATAEFIKAPVNTKRIISDQIKKLKGSKRQIGDPLENILANWSHLLKQSMANQARRSAFNALNSNQVVGDDGLPVVEEVPWKDTVIFKSGGVSVDPETKVRTKTTFIYQKDGREVLGFKDSGKTRFFKVNDVELFQSLSLQSDKHLPRWLSVILGTPKALLTFGATITPSFIAANMIRDTTHTFTISKGFVPFWDTMKGFIQSIRTDKDFVKYMASGNAFVGSYIKADRPEVFAKFAKKIVEREGKGAIGRLLDTPKKMWDFYASFVEASENSTRLALYTKMKKSGKTELESSFAARDIMDFQMKGASPVVQYLIATVPFLNARIQGLYRMGTAMVDNPKVYALKGAMIAMASIALWALFRDDDRYKELEEWEKFTYYHFWIGDQHYRIPKPFETGVLWSSAWTAAADVMVGNEEVNHISSFIGQSFADTLAFNPLPQAAKPILEQYFNKNFFTGRAIEPESFKYRAPADRYYPWDSETAQVIGKVLNVSPRRVQALVRGYLAGLGMGIISGADMITRFFGDFPERPEASIDSYPLVGRFVRGDAKYSKYQTKFYDIFEELNELTQTIKIAERDGDFPEVTRLKKENVKKIQAMQMAKNVKRDLAQIRKEQNDIWLSKVLDAKQKRDKLEVLQRRRVEKTKEFYEWYLKNVKGK